MLVTCFHADFLLVLFSYPADGGDVFLRHAASLSMENKRLYTRTQISRLPYVTYGRGHRLFFMLFISYQAVSQGQRVPMLCKARAISSVQTGLHFMANHIQRSACPYPLQGTCNILCRRCLVRVGCWRATTNAQCAGWKATSAWGDAWPSPSSSPFRLATSSHTLKRWNTSSTWFKVRTVHFAVVCSSWPLQFQHPVPCANSSLGL